MIKKSTIISRKILIAPLNWGLGHATRCIPIVNALQEVGFEPVIAGDGDSLLLLQKEFPGLKSFELPSYNIRYTKTGSLLKYRLLLQYYSILRAVREEQEVVHKIIDKENIVGIISDNRFGVRSHKIPSVYITHQVNVLSGSSTFLTSKFHQKIISKFDECWIPDFQGKANLSGKLSYIEQPKLNLKFIEPLSRFKERIKSPKKYDLMVLISGPEPQRTILEKKLFKELEYTNKEVIFIKGIISKKQKFERKNNITIVNFMLQDELQKAITESDIVIARSGYSTIMDLQKLKARAFFIPTPGQAEQEYLAKHLSGQNIAPYVYQNDFKLGDLERVNSFKGFKGFNTGSEFDFKGLFKIFDSADQ
ncbi:MAG: glycosyltransferase [Bacteroidota bacterium]